MNSATRTTKYDLYASPTPNVLKVLIALEEVGASYRIIPVDVWRGAQFDPAFIELNRNAKVPVLVDVDAHVAGDDNGVIFESGAILFALAERWGGLFPIDGADRNIAMQWLFFQVAGLGPICGQFNHFAMFASANNHYSMSRYSTELQRLYKVLDDRLGDATYLGGESYTIADIATFPWIRNQALRFGHERSWLDIDSGRFENLARWFRAIGDRASVAAAISAFERIRSTLSDASPQELDRVFGRGAYASDL